MVRNALSPHTICIFLLCIFGGCKPDSLEPADYVRYIRDVDNGFIERQDQPGLFLEAFYQPAEYVALMEVSQENLDDTLFKASIAGNSTFYRFILSIGSVSSMPIDEALQKVNSSDVPFDTRKQRMLYQLQNRFCLLAGGDSLPCVFYHAQPSGKINNAYQFILAFESDSSTIVSDRNKDLKLVYLDSLWCNKRFEFVFDRNKINQSPRLKL